MILIKQEAAQKARDANKVIDVDFDKGRWKDTKGITSLMESGDVKIGTAPKTPPYEKSQADIDFEIMERIKADNKKAVEAFEKRNPRKPEKFFYGGFVEQPELGPTAHGSEALASRTRLAAPGSTSTTSTGLNYLLAEDNDNQRVPFKLGGIDKGRRAFLKLMGVAGAGIGALKTGALKLLGKEGATVAKEVTQVPINNIEGMPAWFKPLVNRVIKEGEDVTKQWAYKDRQIVHTTKLPDSQTDVLVTQDLDSGDVLVDIGLEKHGFADGKFGQPVRLEYKASEVIEPDLKTGKGGRKTKEEFNVEEAEFTGGHPENVKFEETTINKFGEHDSNFSEVEEFATGLKKGEGGSGQMASGGRAGYVFGGKVGVKILSLLKNPKKLREAYDNIFPSGDYKYDAEMVAESLVENNPKVFGNRLYEDLTDAERSAVYGAGLEEASTNFAKALKMKRAMDKASKPTKTLEGIKKTGTINISDPDVAEEFARFMKETDPEGSKVIEQTVELSNFNPKGRKKNASGGLAKMLGE